MYESRDLDDFNSRAEHIERGLLRYFTRAAMKATPFGTFCFITEGRFVDATLSGTTNLKSRLPSGRLLHILRLNKALYDLLWAHLRARPAVRDCLVLRSNPSLLRTNEGWTYVTGSFDRETIHQVPYSSGIEFVLGTLEQSGPQDLKNVVARLSVHEQLEANTDQVTAFLNALLEKGILQLESLVTDQTPDWHLELERFLARIDDPHARTVEFLLKELRSILASGRVTDPELLGSILDEVRIRVASA